MMDKNTTPGVGGARRLLKPDPQYIFKIPCFPILSIVKFKQNYCKLQVYPKGCTRGSYVLY